MATVEKDIHKPQNAMPEGATNVNVSDMERWASAIGGGALAAYGLARRDWKGVAMATMGGAMLARGVTGHCPINEAVGRNTAFEPHYNLKVESVYTVNADPARLYAFWRQLENLPQFMRHLESVTDLGGGRSHWVAKGPAGMRVEWDAEIINDVPNETIAWQSLEGSQIQNAGAVRFQPAPGDRGTEVRVTLEYNPPFGKPGALIAKLFGEEPQIQVDEDLRRFKSLIEAGEIPTVDGQPTGKSPFPQESMATALLHPSR